MLDTRMVIGSNGKRAAPLRPRLLRFTFSHLVLILNQPNFFFIGINILYRYREWKKGNEEMRNGGNVVSVNKRCDFEFLIDGKWRI